MRDNCCIKFVTFLIKYVVGLLVLIPIAVLLFPVYRLNDGYKYLWRQSRFLSSPQHHERKVARVVDQVRAWNTGGRKARMCTARPAWASSSIHNMDKRDLTQIDLGDLNCVVEVDEVAQILTVEPGLKIGQLTSLLIPMGWTIPVVPEFESLSIGGLICGAGLESSSTRYGLFAETALEYEVVLSSGELVTCSKDSHRDLFYAIPLSHGTIGFLTSVKIPLLPAKKYVRVEYHVTTSIEEAQTLLETRDHEFVEAIAFARDKFVVMHGDFADADDEPRLGSVNNINRWYKPFFYKHVEHFMNPRRSSKGPHAELIPLRDYYHRYTRAYFWVVPIILPFTNNRFFLALFGWLLPFLDVNLGKRVALWFLGRRPGHFAGIAYLISAGQDFVLPMADFKASIDFFHDLVGVYPLWLCPSRDFNRPGMGQKAAGVGLYFDIGIYGNVSREALPAYDPIPTARQMEEYVIGKGGFQGTYSDMFLTRDQFRTMFNMSLYNKVRAEYGAQDAFPDVYDKVGMAARGIAVDVV